MTAAAERLRKKVEDECYDWLAVAGVSEKEGDSAADQASLCFRMRLIKTREAVRALRNGPRPDEAAVPHNKLHIQ